MPTAFNGKIRTKVPTFWEMKMRASYCHEYIGKGVGGYEDLLKPIEELRNDKKVDTTTLNKFFTF
jgi:hypothetical protein